MRRVSCFHFLAFNLSFRSRSTHLLSHWRKLATPEGVKVKPLCSHTQLSSTKGTCTPATWEYSPWRRALGYHSGIPLISSRPCSPPIKALTFSQRCALLHGKVHVMYNKSRTFSSFSLHACCKALLPLIELGGLDQGQREFFDYLSCIYIGWVVQIYRQSRSHSRAR